MSVVRNPRRSGVRKLAPRFGISTDRIPTANTVLRLRRYGDVDFPEQDFKLNARRGEYMYFALPARFLTAKFLDRSSGFYGGWDGAHNDPYNTSGPIAVDVTIGQRVEKFYVFRTDHSGLGNVHWSVVLGR